MKTCLIVFATFFLSSVASHESFCQTVSFAYDNAGNRIGRSFEEDGGGLKSLAKNDTLEIGNEDIEEELINGGTRVFPNPTHGLITIDFHPDDEGLYFLIVSNLAGYQLSNQRIFEGKNELDISKYPPGTYVITIYSDEKSSKWIIIKI